MACKLFISEITVEPVLFLYMLAIFSQYALFQDLVYTKVCAAKYNESICDHLYEDQNSGMLGYVQTTSSHWILLSTITLVIPSLLIAIYLGSWSDRFGRKWPVVIPSFGGALGCIVFIVISFKKDAPVDWILLASAISGLSGGFVGCIMSCMSYVSSVSSQENRTMRISRLEAMTFLGGTIGPFLSGSMLGITGKGWAFCFMASSYIVACLYAILFVEDVRDGTDLEDDQDGAVGRISVPLPVPVSISASVVASKHYDRPLLQQLHHPQPLLVCRGSRSGSGASGCSSNLNINGDNEVETETDSTGSTAGIGTDTEFDDAPVAMSTAHHNHNHREDDREQGDTGDSRRPILSHIAHEDNVTSTDHDESRNILSRQSNPGEKESCCTRYFNPKHLFDAISTVFKRREGNRRVMIILVILAASVSMVTTAGELDVAYLFAKDQPLNWTSQMYLYYFGMKYGLGAFMLLVGMPICQKMNFDDSAICIVGILSRMASLILYGLSTTTWMVFCAPILGIFSFFSIPAMRALLSKLVGASEQGKMFSFVAIMEDLCILTASLVFNSVYPLTRNLYRGFIFFMAAGLLIIPLIIIACARRSLTLLTPRSPCVAALPGSGTEPEPEPELEPDQHTDTDSESKPAPPTTILTNGTTIDAPDSNNLKVGSNNGKVNNVNKGVNRTRM